MQRFGVNNIPTHYIGKLIIKKLWKDAFLNILNSECVFDGMKQLNLSNDLEKEIFSLNDKDSQMKIISDLMKIIPKYTTEYKLLFNYYKSGKNSFQNSIKNLNKQLQVLFPHSYQSYIWNLSVSYRIEKFGKKLIIGDIVKKHDSLYEEKNQEEDFNYDDEEDNDNKNIENKNNENNNNEDNKNEKLNNIFTNNFDYITEENINKYSFFDLVLPIVGYEIYYPKNEMKNYIEELLKKDDLTINDFKYQNLNFYTTGYFRKVIEKPLNDIKYDIIHHDNPDEDLQTPYYNIENHPNPKGNKYTAVRIIFQLPQSTYATMLFREITKISSAGNFQAYLSNDIKEKVDN
jgi:tRNA pseudouridine13 synthase